jgi:hypothetical protein
MTPVLVVAVRSSRNVTEPANLKPIERVAAVVKGEPVDRLPFCLFPQLDMEWLPSSALVAAMEAFVEKVEPDVVAVPYCYGYTLPNGVSLERANDLAQVVPVHGRHGDFGSQQDAIRHLCNRYHGKRPVVAVIPSPYYQLQKLAGSKLLLESPAFLAPALQALTTSLVSFIKVALASGVSGFVIEEVAASHEVMTPTEYKERHLDHLKAMFEAAKPGWCVAQFLGRRIFWEELKLECEGIGWPVAAGPNLSRGAMRWKGFTWGGLDPTHWGEHSAAYLRGSLAQVLSQIPGKPLLLATPGGIRLRLDQWAALGLGLRRLPSPDLLRETPEQRDARRAATPPRPRSRREAREEFVPPMLPVPVPQKGAKIRLHGKSTPAEPLSPPDSDQLPPPF